MREVLPARGAHLSISVQSFISEAPIQMFGSERTSVFLYLSGPYCHPKGLLLVDGSHGDRGTSVVFLERQRTPEMAWVVRE